MATFFETVTAAINDLAENGYDSEQRLEHWTTLIRQAAIDDMVPERVLQEQLVKVLRGAYERLVERGGVLRMHPGIGKFTLEKIKPKLRPELDRRIVAAANLIRLNRDQTIADTLRRFQGWATSIPLGGVTKLKRGEVKNNVRKELASLPFRERRVLIVSAHQLFSSISGIMAEDAGAIAAAWRSNYQQLHYDFRIEHRDRDSRYRGEDFIYLVRNSWAHRQRLVKAGEAGFTDQVSQPGFEVFCRCWWLWLYSLSRLPEVLLTNKGKEALAKTSRAFA